MLRIFENKELLRVIFKRQTRGFQTGQKCMAKDIRFGEPVRAMMMKGVETLTAAVGLTMGPKGRTVALEQFKSEPKITKDGATVAKAVDLMDPFQNAGAKLVVEVADCTNKKAGDGTTTATVLACSITKDGMAMMGRGRNPLRIKEGIHLGVDNAIEHLKSISVPVSTRQEIKQVSLISANGDEHIGELIATAMEKAGRNGVVTVKDGTTLFDEVEVINGLQIESGYISPYFTNSKKNTKVEFSNAYILYCNFKINSAATIVPVLELALKKNKPLLIVAEDVTDDALNTLVINKIRMGLNICAVKAPSFGEGRTESLKDLAVATGGEVYGEGAELDLKDVNESHFGKADEITVTNEETLILKGRGNPEMINKRAEEIDYLIQKAKNDFIREGLEERKARLVSGVAVIKIGGYSELDIGERKDRVNDSLNATRAAIEEGIVPGGGTALIRCIPRLNTLTGLDPEVQTGVDIIKKALTMPCFTIAKNAGVDPYEVVKKVESLENNNFGYDALNGKYVDMIKAGIIDPTKVVRMALKNAAAVSSLLSSAEVVIAYDRTPKKKKSDEEDAEEEEHQPLRRRI